MSGAAHQRAPKAPAPPVDIASVNAMSDDAFVEHFGGVLEDAPYLAADVATCRPFVDASALAGAFGDVVRSLEPDAALILLLAHPELGARRPMAAASVEEQASAGLPDAEATLRHRLAEGNAAYRQRFGFPFILAVRGRTPSEIVDVLEARLANDRDRELAAALDEVCAIARLRVDQLVDAG